MLVAFFLINIAIDDLRFSKGGWKKNNPPKSNHGWMVMNPMVESVKHHHRQTQNIANYRCKIVGAHMIPQQMFQGIVGCTPIPTWAPYGKSLYISPISWVFMGYKSLIQATFQWPTRTEGDPILIPLPIQNSLKCPADMGFGGLGVLKGALEKSLKIWGYQTEKQY